MANWNIWFPDVLPHVPGAPPPVVRHELRRAAQSLLTQTRAWQMFLPTIASPANTAELALAPVSAALQRIVRIEGAWLDDRRLTPTTADELDASFGDDWTQHTGSPERYLQLTPGMVTLYPKPTAAATKGLRVRVSLCPADGAASIPDDLAARFSTEIQEGAKGLLMLYPNKPWSNPQLGASYLQSFNAMAARAGVLASRSQVGGRIASRPVWA